VTPYDGREKEEERFGDSKGGGEWSIPSRT